MLLLKMALIVFLVDIASLQGPLQRPDPGAYLGRLVLNVGRKDGKKVSDHLRERFPRAFGVRLGSLDESFFESEGEFGLQRGPLVDVLASKKYTSPVLPCQVGRFCLPEQC